MQKVMPSGKSSPLSSRSGRQNGRDYLNRIGRQPDIPPGWFFPTIRRHYVHIDNEAVKQAINAQPQGNILSESKTGKSIEEKHKEAIALLNSKSQLNETEIQILKILQ